MALEARGLRVVVFPTLSSRPAEADFVSTMRATVNALEQSNMRPGG